MNFAWGFPMGHPVTIQKPRHGRTHIEMFPSKSSGYDIAQDIHEIVILLLTFTRDSADSLKLGDVSP